MASNSILPPRQSMLPPPGGSVPPPPNSVAPPRNSVAPARNSVAPARASVAPLRGSIPPLAVATLAALVQACSSPTEAPPGTTARQSIPLEAPSQLPACVKEVRDSSHGMWVWGTEGRLAQPDAAEAIIESAHRAELNEVYLSVNKGALKNPKLPSLIDSLANAGLRVEALMGEANWYEPAAEPEMFGRIDEVGAYNKAHEHGFAAIHLDVEPHQLPQNKNDHSFLPELANALNHAASHAGDFCMSTSADVPRFALDEAGPALANAVPRLFVMLYQLSDKGTLWLADASADVLDHTFKGLNDTQRSRLVVSLRVEDYPDALPTMTATLDAALGDKARYGGWAIHDEAKYRALAKR